jgi:O-antigen ligase
MTGARLEIDGDRGDVGPPAARAADGVPRRRARHRQQPAPRLDVALFSMLLLLLALAPLPLASDRPLPAGVLAVAAGVLLALWGLGLACGRIAYRVPLSWAWPAVLPFLLVAGWVAVQAAPWTPEHLHHELWTAARATLDPATLGAISVNPARTWSELARLLAYGAIFWLALQFCRAEQRATRAALALAVAGIAYAGFGLVMTAGGPEAFAWYFGSAMGHPGRLTSTFASPHGYAAYAGIGMLAGLAVVAGAVERAMAGGARAAVIALAGPSSPALAVGLLALLLGGVAMMMTQSRVGVVAAAAALAVYGLALAAARLRPVHAVVALLVVPGAWLVAELLGDGAALRLAGRAIGADMRLLTLEASLEAIRDRPLLGTGWGTYGEAMRAFEPQAIAEPALDSARNGYLLAAVELGLPAFGLLMLALAWVVLRCAAAVVVRRRQRATLALTLAVTVLLGIHAAAGPGPGMPAVAATYAFVLGLGLAQCRSRSRAGAVVRARGSDPAGGSPPPTAAP